MAIRHPKTDIGIYETDVNAALARLSDADIIRRIWREDYTVWKPEPTEITNRLGWLAVTEFMNERLPMLQSFAKDVQNAGFRHVVLLGMGGSSLGAEVLSQVFGSRDRYPELIVLDSTLPESVQAVVNTIDPALTLFLVCSKSGTTTEPLILYAYFRDLLIKAVGKEKAGHNFVAITDDGTPLATLAQEEGFRQIFLNPADIGGRYSILSYFGLVPATLIGIDITTLLLQANRMRETCSSHVPPHENSGFWLGACLGTLAMKGLDKLTLVMSVSIGTFGLWIEQLIAESTGKDGKGIIPIANEPLMEPTCYGNDRLFIYLRIEGDRNQATDTAIGRLISAGHPVVVLKLRNTYDMGAEFFRWEFATAVAGAVLCVNPFDQPDVQKAKDTTGRLLQEYAVSGRLPRVDNSGSLADLLKNSGKGRYLAIMAYLYQTPEMDEVLAELRREIGVRYHIATILGYGPRFLHSTGQLYKGGQNTGLFLQIVANHVKDLPVPGKPYTFGTVADAQALGDYQSLQAAGRQVIRVQIPSSDLLVIRSLIARIE
ncbi:MAG: glucose-6-phosphate isomerase [Dehalococcoidia bacterium]|nr:glucose-6-phosphate isomerase [Dehalococcoidia bacterium]